MDPRSPRKDKCNDQMDDTAEATAHLGVMDDTDCENLDVHAVHDTHDQKVTTTEDSRGAVSAMPKEMFSNIPKDGLLSTPSVE